jgi:hypothetical protein
MDAPTGRLPDDLPYRVSLGEPGQVAAGLPHLLGFHPHESLVLVSLTGPLGNRVGLTVRADLPPPGHAAALAAALVGGVLTDRPQAVLLAVVSEEPGSAEPGSAEPGSAEPGSAEPGSADLPHRDLVRATTLALVAERVPLRDALLVRGGRWWSYDCPSSCCRPDAGTPLPTGTSELAVATVAAGVVVADSREELAARLAPRGGAGGRVVPALTAVSRRVAAEALGRAREVGPEVTADESWAAVVAGLAHARAGTALSDSAMARLLWGLRDGAVRDRALRLALDDDGAADVLWTDCVRRAPRRYVPAPATLLAVCAWLRGDGATAGVALERALAADPRYPLARLLSTALAACLPPDQLRDLVRRAGELTGS